ncbi:MAG: alpha/beta hydrolase [Desulfobacterales bacterium]|nr:MAG: alpha/beta hydrolase [Desulfobacterales bacterium]
MSTIVFQGYTAEQLEQQYNARATIPDCENIFEQWRTLSAYTRRQCKCELDVPYASGSRGFLDLFLPQNANAPVHMFIHGGYWRLMDKSDFSFLAQGLVEKGALVVIVNYGLCPSVSISEIVQQMRAACQWIWSNCRKYSGNPDAIHVSGHSAGGHLTAMLMATDWPAFNSNLPANLIKSGVAISGLFDLEPMLYLALNNDLKLDKHEARLNSPIIFSPSTDAPLSIVVGKEESDEFKRQSYHFSRNWLEQGAEVTYLEMPHLHHFSIVDQMQHPDNQLTQIMLRHMELI